MKATHSTDIAGLSGSAVSAKRLKFSGFARFQALTLTKTLAMSLRRIVIALLAPALLFAGAGCGRESGDARACASFRKYAETGGDGTTKALKETIDTVLDTASSQEIIDAAMDIKVYMDINVSVPGKAKQYAQALMVACDGK